MDNSPRNRYLREGGTAIDASSEMALFARQLSKIAQTLGKHDVAGQFEREADTLSELINRSGPKSVRAEGKRVNGARQAVPSLSI
jgi:hypothetical protein